MLATGWNKALVLAGRPCCQLVLAWGCRQGGLVASQYCFLLAGKALLPVSTGLGVAGKEALLPVSTGFCLWARRPCCQYWFWAAGRKASADND